MTIRLVRNRTTKFNINHNAFSFLSVSKNKDMLRKLLQRKRHKLPKQIKDSWFAIVVHTEDAKLPPAFDKDGIFINYSKGDIVPMLELPSDLLAYYKITKIHRKSGGDWLYDTDRYNYDLVFESVGKKEKDLKN